MSDKLFNIALRQCNLYARSVEIGFFGEQLLHPKYDEFVLRMKDRRFLLSVNTNLSLCTRETFLTYNKAKLDCVRFSIDAEDANVFNICRPGPVKNLDGKLVDENNRLSAIKEKIEFWLAARHVPTRLVFVKSSYNRNQKKKFLRYWIPKLGKQDHILMKNIVSYGGKVRNPLIENGRCNVWDIGYVAIAYNGFVTPCNLDVNLELSLGNIINNNLYNLYYSKPANDLRKKTGCGNNINPCRMCIDSNNWKRNEVYRKK